MWKKHGPIGPRDLSTVARMMQAVAHRGPDDEGSWSDGRLALGHRRLSIIDLTRDARQPMSTTCGKGVLAYNGEVYNFRALRNSLQSEGRVFRTASDVEVVLEALHHWGPTKAIPLFNGMFSIAYFDAREGALWLSRDRLGIKPMSFAETAEHIVFASEDKAILACGDVARDVDAREITLRLAGQNRDSSYSLFERVERLPPAGLWKLDESGIEKGTFWGVLEATDAARIAGDAAPDGERHAELEAMITQSVRLHCISDAPVATACSGGVDSGLITALAKRERPEIHGYVVDPQLGHSEAESAERTGRHVGVELRRVPVDKDRFFALWPRMAWHLESGGWHPSRVGLLALTEQCRADGVKVLLTGEGADELFGGYQWQQASMRMWRTPSLLKRLFRSKRSLNRRFERQRYAPFATSIGNSGEWERNIALRSLAPDLNFLQIKLFDRLLPVTPPADRAFLGSCLYDLCSHLQDLLHRHDRLSMAASVELRVPFIENRLIDFAMHLPRRFKYRDQTGKWLLKRVAEKHIPRQNVYAPKIGFGMSEAFSDGAEGLLADGLLQHALKWPAASVGDLVALAARDESSRMRLIGLELFLRLFSGGETPENLTDALHAASRDTR